MNRSILAVEDIISGSACYTPLVAMAFIRQYRETTEDIRHAPHDRHYIERHDETAQVLYQALTGQSATPEQLADINR